MPARSSSTAERLVGRLVPPVGAIALCGAALAAVPGITTAVPPDSARLPDLDQEVPWDLQVTSTARVHRLGFASAVTNIGDGPLIVSGRRERTADTMIADQLVERSDAPMAVVERVGLLRYVQARDHEHRTCWSSSATSCAGPEEAPGA